jgi:c-di-GMP-binding flagellar brake protein YcgR
LYTTSGTDRRKHPRAEIICPVIIQTKRTVISGETQNISAGGALIRCRKLIRPNQVMNMFISVSLLNPRVSVSAKVIRSNISYSANEAGTYDIGVEFRAVSDQDQELISTMVAEHLKSENIDWREEEPEK